MNPQPCLCADMKLNKKIQFQNKETIRELGLKLILFMVVEFPKAIKQKEMEDLCEFHRGLNRLLNLNYKPNQFFEFPRT